MKRQTPLGKGKPLKTSQNGQKRAKTGLRQASKSRASWLRKYEAKKEADPLIVPVWSIMVTEDGPKLVKRPGFKTQASCHHALGRVGARILFYSWFSHEAHDWTHDNATEARKIGALLPEYEGRISEPGQYDPLGVLEPYRAYIDEHQLLK